MCLTLREQALTPHKSVILCFNIFLDRGIYFCIFNIFLHSFSIDFIDYLYSFLAFLDKGFSRFSLFSTSPVNTYFPLCNWKDLQNKPTVYLLLSFPLSLLKMNGFVFSTFSIGETRETFVISINGKHKSNTCQSLLLCFLYFELVIGGTFVFSTFWIVAT